MIIRNETSKDIFLGWIGKTGKILPKNPGQIEIDDRESQNPFLKQLFSVGDITILSFNSDFLDYVVQAEIGGGGGGDIFGPTVVVGNTAAGDTTGNTHFLDDIQSAVNSIAKGCVYIKRGDYNISTKITLKNDIKILGEGRSTALIKDPTIDGIFSLTGLTDVLIKNVLFTQTANSGTGSSYIEMDGARTEILNCYFQVGSPAAGSITRFINLVASDQIVESNKFDGASLVNTAINVQTSNNHDIRFNRFTNMSTPITGISSGTGIDLVHNRGL